jgi:pilus assembly protein CpaC
MTTGSMIRTVSFAALLAASGLLSTAALAADAHVPVIQVAASEATSRFIPLGIGKSVAIDLPADIKDVLVADPSIANAVVRTARRVYMIGVKVGQTNIFFFDAQGRQIAGFDIAVTRDLNGVRAALRQAMPDADIRIEGVGDQSVMLTGTAASPVEAQQAYDIAAKLVGSADRVVNGITVRGRDQVMLKVTVAEVQRDVIKQLGIDLSGQLNYGTAVVNFNTDNPFSATGQPLSTSKLVGASALNSAGVPSVQATLRAMEQANVIRTLAEPTLTAISGETASFLVGGEFPYPIPGSASQPPTVDFKKFGVTLTFTPVVLAAGRISLKVLTEVSELSPEGSVTIGGTTVPSLKTRRAETVVEIPSGGSLAMAGMIQEQTKQAINGIPALMHAPILGTLFRSHDYVNHRSELMVLVTPYVVHAVAPTKLARPDDGYADANDPQGALLGRFNRIYGSADKVEPRPAGTYHGKIGFILD